MKYIILSFFIIIMGVSGYSQEIIFPINDNGEIEFLEIVKSDNTKDQLYSNAKEWIAKTFGDYKRVIQFEDDNNRKLILKGLSNVYSKPTDKENLNYTITIECKDNKYRYVIDNITYEREITYLGVTAHGVPMSPLQRYTDIDKNKSEIERLRQVIDVLENKAKSDIKKRELSIIQKGMKDMESKITGLKASNDSMVSESEQDFEIINGIISSLKYAMGQNDDF